MHLRTWLAPLVLLLAAGCSLPQAATPPNQSGSSEPSSSATAASPDPAARALAAIQACDLLTVQELSTLGIGPQGRPETVVGLRRCNWGRAGATISTAIDDQSGIDQLDLSSASRVTDVTIGRHRGKRAEETGGPGFCRIDFAVGDTASVGIQALYSHDTPQACAVADKVATFVEAKLP
jgi:hypothetical protein